MTHEKTMLAVRELTRNITSKIA